jgi:uncharacterized protein YbjT (DUF2867 family)
LILVSGSTGKVGSELVHLLSQAGERVRALVRDPARATSLILPGVELVRGDLEDPETLDAAMHGIEKAFLLPPGTMRQVKQEAQFIDAASRAKLRHVVKLSLLSADPKSPGPIPQWHGMAERRLEQSGLAFTHLRPNFYMQNLLWFARSIRAKDAFFLPLKDARAALIDVRDVAAAAAAVLTTPGHEGRTYAITGPESLSFGDVAAILSEATGRPISYVDIEPAEFKKLIIRQWNVIEPYADAAVSIWRGMSAGGYQAVEGDLVRLLGRPARRLAGFVAENLDAFLTQARPRGARKSA